MLNCKIETGILRELTIYIQLYGKNALAWTSNSVFLYSLIKKFPVF